MTGSSRQFALFRIALGAFLAAHFLALLPYAEELYSPRGMYPSEFGIPFVNIFGIIRSEAQMDSLFVGLAFAALLFAAGYHSRILAVILWLGWASLTNRLPFLYIPSEGLVGWLLLLSAAVPSGEAWSFRPYGAKTKSDRIDSKSENLETWAGGKFERDFRISDT